MKAVKAGKRSSEPSLSPGKRESGKACEEAQRFLYYFSFPLRSFAPFAVHGPFKAAPGFIPTPWFFVHTKLQIPRGTEFTLSRR
jgi:hypothetical protein